MKKLYLAIAFGIGLTLLALLILAWQTDLAIWATLIVVVLVGGGLAAALGSLGILVTRLFRRVRKLESRKAAQPSTARDFAAVDLRQDDDLPLIAATRERMTHELLTSIAKTLPNSNGSRHYEKIDARVGIITDEYMFNFYKDVFRETIYLSPSNHQSALANTDFDAIFYVTGWRGINDDEWRGMMFRDEPRAAFDAIVTHARNNSIPLVFQSIEDPSNFEHFLEVARHFDHIFTSDSDSVENYKKELGHDRVYFGEYGANPLVNNPVGSHRFSIPTAFFAGSYPERYPERTQDMQTIFDSLLAADDSDTSLLIADRNYGSGSFQFPSRFVPSVIGPFGHEVLQRIHKLFAYSVNFNSIKASPTMCAMRVYELQAQAKPMLSNYALSVFNKFPQVQLVPEETDLSHIFTAEALRDADVRAQIALNDIMSTRTSFAIVSKMAERIGLPVAEERSGRILVIGDGDDDAILEMLDYQTYRDFEFVPSAAAINGIDDRTFGYVAVMSDEYHYSPSYLEGRINAFRYTDVDFVTQKAQYSAYGFTDGPVHEFVDQLTKPELSMVATDSEDAVDVMLGRKPSYDGSGYAVDPYQVDYEKYLRAVEHSRPYSKAPLLSVVVPVYNNGKFLLAKALPSLKSNDMWMSMDVVLVDDGSTDESTIRICKSLADIYPNVQFFSFADGGSGSASRPRNKGVELAKARLVSYLDPDNEISPGGYDVLTRQFRRLEKAGEEIDFVSGYQVKVSKKTASTGRHARGDVRLVRDPRSEFFERGKFPVVSTQAAVIRKEMLQNGGVEFVERAAGQDTLYGWEVLLNARTGAFVDDAFLLYYAERSDSVTNTVSPQFFRKFLTNEQRQVEVLQKHGLLEKYKESHLDNFVKNWYLVRLDAVDSQDRDDATGVLSEIVGLYGKNLADFRS